MSGQYPSNYSPLGGGQFNPQQQQNMVNAGMMQMYPTGGVGVMNQVGMQSPSHVQQQQQQQQQQMMQQQMHMGGPTPQQQQQQQQQQQMGMIGPIGVGVGVGPVGMVAAQMGGGMMQQQQQQQQQQQMSMGGPGPQQQQQQQQPQQQPGLIGAAAMQSQHGGGQPTQASTSMLASSQSNSHKEINIVALSRLGQETVQDITSRFQEIFAALKIIQPTANRDNTEKKVQEHFRTIRLLFKRVRIIYEKCNDGYPQGMEYTNVESLIPYKDEPDHRPIEPTQCEEYRKVLQENQELIDTVKLKNRQLREIIDRTRIIIWEINTMLSMRRS